MSLNDADRRDEQKTELDGIWRTALWIIEALPPTRRPQAEASTPLRRRKIAAGILSLVGAQGEAAESLHEQVVEGAPFLHALLWWVEDRGFGDEAGAHWHLLRSSAGANVERATGSPSAAYPVLRAFAGLHVSARDTAFSERAIMHATVRELLGGI